MPSLTVYIHASFWDELYADAKRAGVKPGKLVAEIVRCYYGHAGRSDVPSLARSIVGQMARADSPRHEAARAGVPKKAMA